MTLQVSDEKNNGTVESNVEICLKARDINSNFKGFAVEWDALFFAVYVHHLKCQL